MTNDDIQKIILFALDEITSCDSILRLSPDDILHPINRNEAINYAFKSTCEKYNIDINTSNYKITQHIKVEK